MDQRRKTKLRQDLMRKGADVNAGLTRLLAGENATLATIKLPDEDKPGIKPKERLRLFLDQIVRAQRRLDTDEWGLCISCRSPFEEAALDEVPWLEECADCEAERQMF